MFMEHFEEISLDTADHKPAEWLRYVDGTSVVWSQEQARLQQFLHLSSLRHTIKLTMEMEANNTLPFLDIFVMKRVQNRGWKCTGNRLILVVICISIPTTHIT
jgi:hypothetical protein